MLLVSGLSSLVVSCPVACFLSCRVLSCFVLSWRVMSCLVISCLVVALLVFSCFCVVLPGLVSAHLYLSCLLGPVLFCLVLPCRVLTFHGMPRLIFSCLVF